ncbi:MAG: ABC transporter permease [Eubacteriales bacterium]|nr:ABC transporter permease [Eubacteriales bacterium]
MKKYLHGFFRYRFLLNELVKKGIKLKYRRSYLGIVWSLLEPLMTMIVLTLIFGELLGKGDKTFPVYVLSGRLMYSFFNLGTGAALRAIRGNAAMIKKVYIPKYLYPLAGVIFNYIIFLLSLVVLILVAGVLGIRPTWYLLQAIIPLIVLFLLTLGVGMILATVGVFFRDMEYLWGVMSMMIMYASAIFYFPEKILKGSNGIILKVNPLFGIIRNFRAAIMGEPMNVKYMVYAAVFSVISLIIGVVLFYRKQDEFILNI